MSQGVELNSARLRLRRFTEEDADFVIALVNDAGWLRFIGDRDVRTRESAVVYIARLNRMHDEYGHGALRIELRATGEPIGMAGLFRRPGLAEPDVGFALLPEFYGQGYAYEAAGAVLAAARRHLGLSRVLGVTVPENSASIHLLEKLGLRGVSAVQLLGAEEWVCLYALDWNNKKPAG